MNETARLPSVVRQLALRKSAQRVGVLLGAALLWLSISSPHFVQAATMTQDLQWESGTLQNLETYSKEGELRLAPTGTWGAQSWRTPDKVLTIGSAFASDGTDLYVLRGNADVAFWRYKTSSNTWEKLANAPAGAYYGADLIFANGNIYAIFGGYQQAFARYSISSNSWEVLDEFPSLIYRGGSITYDGTFVYGVPGNSTQEFYRYNIATNQWSPLAPTPATIAQGADLTYVDGLIFTPRGLNSVTFFQYDISAGSWTTKANIIGSLNGDLETTTDGSDVYLARQNNNATFYKYDVSQNSWSSLTNAPYTINNGGLQYVASEDVTYVFRGNGDYRFWKYDQDTNTFLGPAEAAVGVGIGSDIVHFGGQLYIPRGNSTNVLNRYDPTTNAWATLAVAPGILANDTKGVAAGSSLYFFMGNNNTTFYKYTPGTDTWATVTAAPATVRFGGALAYPGSGDYLYATRGNNTNGFWRFNILTETWDDPGATDLPAGILANYGSRLVSDGSYVYFTGGQGMKVFYRYEIATQTWTELAALPFSPYLGTDMAYRNGKIVALAGYYRPEVYEYSIADNAWRQLQSLAPYTPTEVGPYSGASIELDTTNDVFYVMIGNARVELLVYNPGTHDYAATGTWESGTLDFGHVESWNPLSSVQETPGDSSISYQTRTSSNGTDWSSWETVSGGVIASAPARYIQARATLYATTGQTRTPIIKSVTVSAQGDGLAPTNPATTTGLSQAVGGAPLVSGNSYKHTHPYFSWTPAADADSTVEGYYVYFGSDELVDPSDPETSSSFQTTTAYQSNTPLSTGTHYLRIATKDSAGNVSVPTTAFVYEYSGISPPLGEVSTTAGHFTGTTTDVQIVGDSIKLSSRAGGFWQEERLTVPPGAVQWGGLNSVYDAETNRIYVLAAANNALFWAYDLATDTWSTLAPAPAAVNYGGGLVAGPDGYLYATRGTNLTDFWRYDIQANTWDTLITGAPLTISYGSSMVFDGSQYIYISRGNGTNTFWRYDTGSDEWFTLAGTDFGAPSNNINNFINRGADLTMDRANGLIYATQGNLQKGFSVYNTNTGNWTVLPDSPTLPYDGSSLEYVAETQAIYYTAGNSTPYLYKYDIVDGEWILLNEAPAQMMYGAGASKVGDALYYFRGGATTGFYKYNITKDSWLIPTRGLFSRVFDGSTLWAVSSGADLLKGDGNNYYLTRGNYGDDFVRWNQTTGEISRLANIPTGSITGSSMVYDNEDNAIYLTSGTFERHFFRYDIAQNTWTRISTDPVPAVLGVGASMVFDGSRFIYATRGNSVTLYRYDKDAAAGSRWSTLANTPAALGAGAELLLKDGYLYTMRGAAAASNPLYRFDIAAGTWTTLAPFGSTVGADGWLVDGNDGYLYLTRATNSNDLHRYSIAGNSWSSVTGAPAHFTTGASGEGNGVNKIFATAGAGTNTYGDALYTYVMQTAESGFLSEGEYISQAHDLGSVYKWSNITISQELASNTDLTFATRSSADGTTWSDWSNISQERIVGPNTVAKVNSPVNRYLQVRISFTSADGVNSAELDGYTIYYYTDTTRPTNPQTAGLTGFSQETGGVPIVSETWYNHASPHFDWAEPEALNGASDTATGSGVAGYYVYFGPEADADPAEDGDFQEGSEFTASGLTSGTTSYLRIKAVDGAGLVAAATWQPFIYKFDSSQPAAPATLVADPAGYTATNSFDFTWTAASSSGSPVIAWCYKTDAPSGPYATEQCTADAEQLTLTDVPSYQVGTNVFQVRAKNQANTFSQPKTVNYYYADPASAPAPPTNLHLTTPATNSENSFGFSWDVPAAFLGSATNLSYRFSVNAVPTPQSTTATSLRYLNPGAYATLPGENVFYVVAQDEAGNINYTQYSQISFFANTVAPGIPVDVEIADVSVKNTAAWRLALSWEAPTASGSGVYNYAVYRSTDAETYSQISTTTSTSYVDTGLSQRMYYYKIKACDNTRNCGEFSSVVNLLPDGRFIDAPTLTAGPTVSEITTRKAVVSWSTNRISDSKVAYGTDSGEYFDEEVGSSEPVTGHILTLNNLTPGTKYYFKVKWTDEDGNTGESDENSFTTQPPPSTEEPTARNVGLTSAVIEFVTRNASKVKLYYGESSAFGGIKEIITSTAENTQVVELSELKDATKYYYKINTLDIDGTEYEGEIHSFETLPRPAISNVIVQQINGTAKTTLLVRWATNTAISSIVTYYPTAAPQQAVDEVNVSLEAGAHQMILFNLEPETAYSLVIRGLDVAGNEAVSGVQQITTSADTRPPQISDLKAESEIIGTGEEATAQLIVSYKTDEPATSQVEYGEGTGAAYSQKSQQSGTPTNNHLIIISGLSPGKVYHLRSVSTDSAGNEAFSIDKVVVTPKATENALDLVVNNLVGIFSFLQ